MTDKSDMAKSVLQRNELMMHSGCGCKIEGNSLPAICGTESARYPEDCGVVPFGDQLLLTSVDYGPCVGNELTAAGQIAACHALSDVFACGGTPLGAEVILMIDRNWEIRRAAYLQDGVKAVCRAEGVKITGGHTVHGCETMIGLAVTATVARDKFIGKRGALIGDTLLISKPLGTGLVVRGFVRGDVGDEELSEAVAVMTTSNRAASLAAVSAGVHAMTDVTGFGLAGHLSEMLLDTGLGAAVTLSQLPVLKSVGRLPDFAMRTKYLENNLNYVREHARLTGERDFNHLAVALDPQTSGGLLVAASSESAEILVKQGFTAIGRFTDRPGINFIP